MLPVAAMGCLDRMQHVEQRMRIKAGLDLDTGIDERRLFGVAPGRGGIIEGSRLELRTSLFVDFANRFLVRRADIAEIAAERNEAASHVTANAANASARRRHRQKSRRSARAACAR